MHVTRGPYGEFLVQPGPLIIYPGCHPYDLHQEYMHMNPDQQHAVQRILLAKDYALLRGLPGTGKTNTLALVIRIMIARQETVVLTSYTHNAVDHVMQKLIAKGMLPAHVVRLGTAASMHPACLPYALHASVSSTKTTATTTTATATAAASATVSSIQELTTRLHAVRLYAGTVFTAARHIVLRTLPSKCDWCVMDEAGQITQPAAVGALLKARKFVLVGDEKQLPPLVVSTAAQRFGMDESLLHRLLAKHPEASVTLTFQYRMHADIMSLCNRLVYAHVMQCGSTAVAQARLPYTAARDPVATITAAAAASWIRECIRPDRAVVLLNTDGFGSNDDEAQLVQTLLHALYLYQQDYEQQQQQQQRAAEASTTTSTSTTTSGGPHNEENRLKVFEVAVITPFRAQVHRLQARLAADPHLAPLMMAMTPTTATATASAGSEPAAAAASPRLHLEVSTVDKYQGKDKDI
eukprot:gene19664-14277_t